MIRVENVQFGYGGRPVFTGLSFSVAAGEILGILGPNGSGKTTLLKLLRGSIVPHSGTIALDGVSIGQLRRRQIARRMAVVPQSAPMTTPFPVDEFVAMGRYPWKPGWFGHPADGQRVCAALRETDTLHLAGRAVDTLSGGELQRVLLARALVQEAPILLLDEANSNLDLDHRLEFIDLLRRLNRERGTTVVQVSHDLDQAADLCQQVLVLDRDGRLVALGAPEEVYTPELFRRVFRVHADIEAHPRTGKPRLAYLAPLTAGVRQVADEA